jgi:long-chain acyl-CoA synthetase
MLLNEFLEKSAELYPDKVALICGDSRLAYGEIDRSANSLGHALIAEGFQRQDRAVIYLDNTTASVISLFGILKAGGVFVMVDPQVKARKLEYITKDCQARALITDTAHLVNVSEILGRLPDLRTVIITDHERPAMITESGAGKTLLSYRTILKERSPSRPASACIDVDLASLIYTSGSTGIIIWCQPLTPSRNIWKTPPTILSSTPCPWPSTTDCTRSSWRLKSAER